MKKLAVILLMITAITAAAQTTTNTNKKITVLHGQISADGKSRIVERSLGECIVSLPSVSELAPDVAAKSDYLKEINGEAGKDAHVKTYAATVTVNYKVRETFVLIITPNTAVEADDPVMEEKERTIMRSKTFASDPGDGDIFAGRSNRKYYYSTPEAAGNNAKARAEAWIKQQQNVLCSAGGGK